MQVLQNLGEEIFINGRLGGAFRSTLAVLLPEIAAAKSPLASPLKSARVKE
jgi:hypothetical protein